jgi:HAD superfamily hydrolase (TIGR01549 family)
MKLYQLLVNKHVGIGQRYHMVHDNAVFFGRIWSWMYLIILNFAYTFLFCRFLDEPVSTPVYEEKRLNIGKSESKKFLSEDQMVRELQKYDVISFDIFDTLIYRPFSNPTDLFYLIGIELEYMDFTRVRSEAEGAVRWKKYKKEESFEVTLDEIWDEVALRTGLDSKIGAETEIRYETEMCYANPDMLKVYKRLKALGKKIIYTSDMYLPAEVLLEILQKNGYEKEQLFLSCEENRNKGSGELFALVKKTLGANLTYIHIGDNEHSDVKRAKRAGFATYPVVNPNKNSLLFRAHDLSPIIGGAYRGIVNNRLNNGFWEYGRYYEYGFIYGGLFILGYCSFIHEYCMNHGIDKLLFLARDGEIIKKIYDKMYPEAVTEYVYSSRIATCKLIAGYDKNEFVKKMVYHKVNQGYTFEKVLKSMELEKLISTLNSSGKMESTDKLTSDNVKDFVEFLDKYWDFILDIYRPQRDAAGKYFGEIIKPAEKIGVVDIGWAGTGAIALRTLVKKEWSIDADIISIVAGTNTVTNAEPYMSEGFLQKGTMVSYLYSSADNRDLWKKHNPSQGYNLFFELLTSSDKPSFKGFYPDEETKGYRLEFLEKEKNPEGILEIQKGIEDFVDDYRKSFGKYDYMFRISGRDAYAPMMVAASHNAKYLNALYKDFELKMEVGV